MRFRCLEEVKVEKSARKSKDTTKNRSFSAKTDQRRLSMGLFFAWYRQRKKLDDRKKMSIFAKKQRYRMAKSTLASHLRSLYKGQGLLTARIVEESPDFAQLISCKQSPGIRLAKKKGIAYTVASGDQVVEIDAQQNTQVVGRIARADVLVQQRVYQLK